MVYVFGHIERKWKHETNQQKICIGILVFTYIKPQLDRFGACFKKNIKKKKFGQRFTVGDLKSPLKIIC